MSESWEDKKKSRKKSGLIVFLCIIVIIIGFFVFNNFIVSDQDNGKIESLPVIDTKKIVQGDSSQWGEPVEVEDRVLKNAEQAGEQPAEPAVPEKEPEKKVEKKPANPSLQSLDLPRVKCSLADKKGLFVQISLRIYFKKKKLEREILFKRDNIKIVVKKILSKKSLSEVAAEPLRKELIREINNLLEKGKITDIEFLDFRPTGNL